MGKTRLFRKVFNLFLWLTWMFGLGCSSMLVLASEAMQERAREVANQVKASVGDEKQLSEQWMRPLTSDESLTTLDNATFQTQVTCLEENQFLEVFVVPTSTGDLRFGGIRQDTDRDGELDRVWVPDPPISGMCANGFVSCSPGSWNECQGYRFSVNESFELGMEEVPMSKLGGCYCINNSCGSQLALTNMKSILGHLGGAAAVTLTNADPYFVTSQVVVNDTAISYYGQHSSSCNSSETPSAHHYLSDSTQLSIDAMASGEHHPIYSALKSSQAVNETASFTEQSCTVYREASIQQVDLEGSIRKIDEGSDGHVSNCGPNCRTITLNGRYDEWFFIRRAPGCQRFEYEMALELSSMDAIERISLANASTKSGMQLWIDDDLVYSQGYAWDPDGPLPRSCRGPEVSLSPNLDVTHHFTDKDTVNLRLVVIVGAYTDSLTQQLWGYGSIEMPIEFGPSCVVGEERLVDRCHAFESQRGCRLFDESVDGVETYANFLSTGLTPLSQTRILSDEFCQQTITRPFFEKRRTYHCEGESSRDFTEALTRSAYIVEHSTDSEFHDRAMNPESGEMETVERHVEMMATMDIESCVEVCKVSREVVANDVASTLRIQDQLKEPTKLETHYLECNAGVCPVASGDTVVTQCQCADFFAESSAIMQTLRMGARDTVCSSGNKGQLQ